MTEENLKKEPLLTSIAERTRKLQTLLIRHQNEWDENLSLQMKDRQVLDEEHKRQQNELQVNEINFHQRDSLMHQQAQQIKDLLKLNSTVRIALRQRHLRDLKFLNRLCDGVVGIN